MLQAPYSFLLYGANNDTQYLLVNNKGNDLYITIGHNEYQNFITMRMGGLEHHNGVYVLEQYLTGY